MTATAHPNRTGTFAKPIILSINAKSNKWRSFHATFKVSKMNKKSSVNAKAQSTQRYEIAWKAFQLRICRRVKNNPGNQKLQQWAKVPLTVCRWRATLLSVIPNFIRNLIISAAATFRVANNLFHRWRLATLNFSGQISLWISRHDLCFHRYETNSNNFS